MKKKPLLSKKQSMVMGLSDMDISILNTATSAISIKDIGSKLNTPRTTLYPYIKTLVSRNLMDEVRNGNKTYFKTKDSESIANLLFDTALSISKGDAVKMLGVHTQIKIFIGKKKLSEAWLLIGNQPKGSTVIGIQPSKSLSHSIEKVPYQTLRKNHELIISRGIFLESYCEEDMYSTVLNNLKNIDALEETLPDFANRKAITYLFEKASFNTTSEFFILSEGVLVIDWKDEFGILIENKSIGIILGSLLRKIKPILKIGNYNQEIQKALMNI